MGERDALEARLAMLARAGALSDRELEAGDAETLRRLVLRRLDAVILPQLLCVTGEGGRVEVEVRHRRIVAVDGEPATLEGVADRLGAALGAGRRAGVATRPVPAGGAAPGGTGVAVAALPGFASAPRGSAELLETLLARIDPLPRAWLMSGGEATREGGDPAALAALPAIPRFEGEPHVFVARRLAAGEAALVLRHGGLGLSLLVPAEAVPGLADLWRSLLDEG